MAMETMLGTALLLREEEVFPVSFPGGHPGSCTREGLSIEPACLR